jgi:hypothetical protein
LIFSTLANTKVISLTLSKHSPSPSVQWLNGRTEAFAFQQSLVRSYRLRTVSAVVQQGMDVIRMSSGRNYLLGLRQKRIKKTSHLCFHELKYLKVQPGGSLWQVDLWTVYYKILFVWGIRENTEGD